MYCDKPKILLHYLRCGRSSIWLEHSPVTGEAAGSSPVARANKKTPEKVFFYYAVRASGLEPKKGVGETFVSPWRKTASNRALETVGF